MNAPFHYGWLVVRLNFRNRMSVVYGYLFPLAFLMAFAVIYRHDPEPVIAHLGKLLTVTALGGACFGLPTSIVAERERGVWRRYRATPQGAGTFVFGQVASRMVLLIGAAAIQIAVAVLLLGMPLPHSLPAVALAFAIVSLALISLGMIIGMIAHSVPAVQALGQCVFLPLLMVGGIAVPVESLPRWTQALSTFFPGRKSVSAIQTAAIDGLAAACGDLAILAAYALAGSLVAAGLFRWDSGRRRLDWSYVATGLALWLLVGAIAGRADPAEPNGPAETAPVTPPTAYIAFPPEPAPPSAATSEAAPTPGAVPDDTQASRPLGARPVPPPTWREVGEEQFATIAFERLPDDSGLVAPMAERGTPRDAAVDAQLAAIRAALPDWAPAREPDPLQRARNLLYIAAVPDLLQMDPLERHVPWLVFDRLRQETPASDLARILYWIAMHPDDGEDTAVAGLAALGLPAVSGPTRRVRERVMIYALKFLKRLESQRQAAG